MTAQFVGQEQRPLSHPQESEVGQAGRPQQQLRRRERERGSGHAGGRGSPPPAPARSAARATLRPPAAPARAYLSSPSNERRFNRLGNIACLGYPERVGPWLCARSARGKLMRESSVHLCWKRVKLSCARLTAELGVHRRAYGHSRVQLLFSPAGSTRCKGKRSASAPAFLPQMSYNGASQTMDKGRENFAGVVSLQSLFSFKPSTEVLSTRDGCSQLPGRVAVPTESCLSCL